MSELSWSRERVGASVAAGLLLLVAIVVLGLQAREGNTAPRPIDGLTDEQVGIARTHGLEVRPNRIATSAAGDDAERAAVAALGREAFEALRPSVRASLARVVDDGEQVSSGLVWVVFTDEQYGPSLSAGEGAGVAKPTTTFLVVDPDSFEVLTQE